LVCAPSEHEEQIGKPIEVNQERPTQLCLTPGAEQTSFSTPAYGARKVQRRARFRAARQNEISERLQFLFVRVDGLLEPPNLFVADLARRKFLFFSSRAGELGAQANQIVLEP
jgi:hypothetical protein